MKNVRQKVKQKVRVVNITNTASQAAKVALLKGLAHAKIIKKSVILFRVLNMTI